MVHNYTCSITKFYRNYNNNNIYFIPTYRNKLVQRIAMTMTMTITMNMIY